MDAEAGKEQGRDQHHPHMPPAIKGVEKAHGLLLVIGGAGFQNGADQYFQQAAAHRINKNGGQDPEKRIREDFGKDGQQDDPGSSAAMGNINGSPVADPVYKCGGKQIHQQLDQEI